MAEVRIQDLPTASDLSLYPYTVLDGGGGSKKIDLRNIIVKVNGIVRYPVEVSDRSFWPNWYVVYNDGWKEQGGILITNGWTTVTYLKAFADTSYTLVGGAVDGDSNLSVQIIGMYNKTATSCQFVNTYGGQTFTNPYSWYACGY